MSKLLLVSYDFYGNYFTCFMVNTLYRLAERTFAQKVQNFKPKCKVIAKHYRIVTLFIIVTEVMILSRFTLNFHISVHTSNEVNCFIV